MAKCSYYSINTDHGRAKKDGTKIAPLHWWVPNRRYHNFEGRNRIKNMLTAIMAVAVTFSAPAFAGDKKEEKKGGK
ncbi:MAG TPA: hypothetical protein PKD12_01585 [Nitrospira sp.]|nr:hypothetical protein [Nitrospira sp.]